MGLRVWSVFPGKALYVVIAIIAAVDLLWLASGDIAIDYGSVVAAAIPVLVVACLAWGLRHLRSHFCPKLPDESRDEGVLFFYHLSVFLEGLLFIRLALIFLPIFNHLTMSVSIFPYTDEWLMQADHILLLPWESYFTLIAGSPFLSMLFVVFYMSFSVVCLAVFLGLLALSRIVSARFFLMNFLITALICVTAGMFFPAEGAVAYMIKSPELLANFQTPPGVYHIPYLQMLRGTEPVVLHLNNLPGLVTFPSFHTAGGIVIAWSCRRTPLFWPAFVYTLLMIAAIPVIGGHYFVDLLAGGLVAITVLFYSQRLPHYRELGKKMDVPDQN